MTATCLMARSRNPDTSLMSEAPDSRAALATVAFWVSIEIGIGISFFQRF